MRAFNEIIFLAFGVALIFLSLALYERLKAGSAVLAQAATIFTLIWAVLVWFPLYLALARATRRHPQIRWAYCWVCAPLMLVFVVAFTGGSWVD